MRAVSLGCLFIILFQGVAWATSSETYEYDALGRLIKVSNASGKDIGYCYDGADNRRAVIIADSLSTPLTDPSCADPIPPPPPPPPFNGTLIVVPLNGFTVIAIP